jgi:DNA-binding IclR family transcriptional regulator
MELISMGILENTASVFKLLTQLRNAVTVSDVVQHLGLPKSSASRLLKQMAERGLLERDAQSLAYRPSLMLLELAHTARVSTSLLELIDDALDMLCRQTGHTGYVSVLDGRDVVVLRVHSGMHALRVVTYAGHRMGAPGTSTGRALLARETDDTLKKRFAGGIAPASGTAPLSVEDLLRRLAEVRQKGWALALDESLPGIGSVGCAVGDPQSGEAMAFCLTFPASMGDPAETARLAALLHEQASRLGRASGDPFWLARARRERD